MHPCRASCASGHSGQTSGVPLTASVALRRVPRVPRSVPPPRSSVCGVRPSLHPSPVQGLIGRVLFILSTRAVLVVRCVLGEPTRPVQSLGLFLGPSWASSFGWKGPSRSFSSLTPKRWCRPDRLQRRGSAIYTSPPSSWRCPGAVLGSLVLGPWEVRVRRDSETLPGRRFRMLSKGAIFRLL